VISILAFFLKKMISKRKKVVLTTTPLSPPLRRGQRGGRLQPYAVVCEKNVSQFQSPAIGEVYFIGLQPEIMISHLEKNCKSKPNRKQIILTRYKSTNRRW